MTPLTILCLTAGEPHARRFIQYHRRLAANLEARYVLVYDVGLMQAIDPVITQLAHFRMFGNGYLESVYDRALAQLRLPDDTYLLRLDDDETISLRMFQWLVAEQYTLADHWKFPRRHLWGTSGYYITTPPLYPDHQTRLSRASHAGGRGVIHAGSPFGGGVLVHDPGIHLVHHKFLVKDRAAREAVAARYDAVQPGAGTSPGMIPFTLPETLTDLTLEVM